MLELIWLIVRIIAGIFASLNGNRAPRYYVERSVDPAKRG